MRSDAEKDCLARRTALNMAPAGWLSYSRRADTYPIWKIADPLIHRDGELNRCMKILHPPRRPKQVMRAG